ncbi:hypothetical protein ECPA23_0597, partial [Escherichia coli PA23]
MTPDTLPALS